MELSSARIVDLVSKALDQGKLSGLSEILKTIAQAADANGCILWQVSPMSKDFLFVLDQWTDSGVRCFIHDLPVKGSKTGEAISQRKPANAWDIDIVAGVYKDKFLSKANIKTFCSVPVVFTDDRDGTVSETQGAVNLYRTVCNPFSKQEVVELNQFASLVPSLYKALRERVSLSVVAEVDKKLQGAETLAPDAPLSKDKVKEFLQSISEIVADTFQCVEASIFLEDRLQSPGNYELMATTWKKAEDKPIYTGSVKGGLTGWVLANASPMKIFDLDDFGRDKEEINRLYPGVMWDNPLDIKMTIRRDLGIGVDEELPPLSYMAAPIKMGDQVVGAIRCCAAKQGPYYFADPALSLLELVAAQISRYWSNWLSKCEMNDENRSWQALVTELGELNDLVHRELTQELPDEGKIFAEALRIIESVVKGAEIVDVRLADEKKQELYFVKTHGEHWDEERKKHRFPLKEISVGTQVFESGKLYAIHDVSTAPAYYRGIFPDTQSMIVAPIQVGGNKFGVLDIRGTSTGFTRDVEIMAYLLGRQLGLYQYLAITIGRLHTAQLNLSSRVDELKTTQSELRRNIDELKRLKEEQTQSFEDLKHQIKSPLNPALNRIQLALKNAVSGSRQESDLFAVRGLIRKIHRIAMSIEIFVDLAKNKKIHCKPSRLNAEHLFKLLLEATKDSQIQIAPERNIRFRVDRTGFNVLKSNPVSVDHDLLEQAIMNLLDNAGKYSFEGTEVLIHGGLTKTGRFHITVTNQGLAIDPRDVEQCVTRGWRSDHAEWTTGEGSGIGLWIVSHIMEANEGELLIIPTNADDITEVKLIMPAPKSQ